MAKRTDKGESAREAPAQAEVEALVAQNGETLRALMRANEAMLEGVAAVGRELMDFGSARMRRDLEAQGALLRCTDAEEAFRLHCDYAREATQQYLDQAVKLMNLGARISRDCWSPFEERSKAALHEISAR